MNFFFYGLGCDAVLLVVRELECAAAVRLADGALQRTCHHIGIENHAAEHVARRAADGLDERGLATQEALFIGIENADKLHLGQVESFAEQVHTNQDIKFPLSEISKN